MSDEEFEKRFEKKMEFLLEQQAKFTANMQKVDERVSKVEDLMGRLAFITTAGFKKLIEKVSAVIDAQIRTEENVSSIAVKVAELAEAQAHTDQRLNVIIDIISEGRSGKSRN